MYSTRLTLAVTTMATALLVSAGSAENIDPCDDASQYAYAENVGWVNFEPNRPEPNVGATVSDTSLTGFIWAENIGWINLDPNDNDANTGVRNDSTGELSGLAWGENVGWINFDPDVAADSNHYGVTIDANGNFDGWAWGENIGWIHLQHQAWPSYKVQTSWTGAAPTCWNHSQCAGQPNGDATCDGNINLADLFALKANFGKSAPWTGNECCADFTQDGSINLADLFVLKAGFGSAPYSPSAGNQSCPP
jgi:hypothetical protein